MKELIFGDKIKDPFLKTYISTFLVVHYPIPIFALFGDTSATGTHISRVVSIKNYINSVPSLFPWFPYSQDVTAKWTLLALPLMLALLYYLIWVKFFKPYVSNTITRIEMGNITTNAATKLSLNPYFAILLSDKLQELINGSLSNLDTLNDSVTDINKGLEKTSEPSMELVKSVKALGDVAHVISCNHQRFASFRNIFGQSKLAPKYNEGVRRDTGLKKEFENLLALVEDWDIKKGSSENPSDWVRRVFKIFFSKK